GLIFQGSAAEPAYLFIDEDGRAELRSAAGLWGKDTWETADALVEELDRRERDLAILSIGPAGESLVRWAAIMGGRGHAAAHNGVGAVMGSKLLKAVVIARGRQTVPVKDRRKLADVARSIIEPVIAAEGGVHYYGTLNGVHSNYARGNLPVKNYTTNVWDIPEEEFERFTGPWIHEHFEPRRGDACWACSNRHCQMMTVTQGPYAGLTTEEPEYEQLSAFSANLGIGEVGSVFMLSNTVDRLGLDTNEGGWVCSLVMECFERGILTGEDTGGLEIIWGNAEAARQLLHRVARREGVGDALAEGVRRAVGRIGRGAEEVGVYTMKGGTPRGHDHRGRWTEMFDTCVSESGALENTLMVADLTQFGLPETIDPFDPDLLARAEARMKGAMQFEDSMVTCRFNTRMNVERLAEAVSAVTGWDFTFDEAMDVGRRAVNTMRAFNIRSGLTADLERPSPRYGSTPKDGPASGKSIGGHFEKMLQDYYRTMGWDERGRPLPETLDALGLENVTADLWPQRE
ncbi:MAG: hypothetical protein FJ313_07340, partial [Gemmatimonadetes bacterium]|nr:hypothetical protein [Gemmatimonadota bacterium]